MPRPSTVFVGRSYDGEPMPASGCVAATVRLLAGGVVLIFALALVIGQVDDVDAWGFIVSAAGLLLIYTAAGGGWQGSRKPATTMSRALAIEQLTDSHTPASIRRLDAAGSPPTRPEGTAPCSETLHGRFGPEPCPLQAWAEVSAEGMTPHALCRPHAQAVLRLVPATRIVRQYRAIRQHQDDRLRNPGARGQSRAVG
jgi:hypothetical protein